MIAPIKFPGGKSRQLERILPLLAGERIVEPFAGSAIVAAGHPARTKWVNDSNRDIIAMLGRIMCDPDDLIAECKELFVNFGNVRHGYEAARKEFNSLPNWKTYEVRRAALFIYLNRHGYNGLVRYNRKGEYNVPFGSYKKVAVPAGQIMDYHRALALGDTLLTAWDFESVLDMCGTGDAVYCDPPYLPVSTTASFTAYAAGWKGTDHERLARAARAAADRGAAVVVSAAGTLDSLLAYDNANDFRNVPSARRSISCKGAGRGGVNELLFIYRGPA